MNDEAAEVKKLLAPLRDRPVGVADVERLAKRRARIVSAVKQENVRLYDRRTRRRALTVGLSAALALAAALGLFVGTKRLSHPERSAAAARPGIAAEPRLTLVRGDSTAAGHPLRTGDTVGTNESEIETRLHGGAELESTTGLDLNLGEATRLSVAGIIGSDKSNHVELRQGEVTCQVPHLAEGEHFSVVTPDARVVVHGTVFSVRFDPSLGTDGKTCVRVTQGVVIVHHARGETALNAGDSWGCSLPEPAANSQNAGLGAPSAPAAAKPPPRGPRNATLHDAPAHGTLAEETALLQSALAAERVGNRQQARALLQTLLSEYPSSPLSQQATLALARVSAAE